MLPNNLLSLKYEYLPHYLLFLKQEEYLVEPDFFEHHQQD